MKTILFKLFISGFVLIGFSFLGCSDNDDPFAGTDNYITSFSLTKEGVTYKGMITDNKVQLSVPKNIDLDGAAAEYKLTELASISPDPATIQNWDEVQQFTVTARNNTVREYDFMISYTDISEVGSVVLTTQEDVEKFAQSNIEVVDGNLIIGANEVTSKIDSIKDLSGLLKLKKVTNSIIINNTFAATNTDGLVNLESAGAIYIKNLTTRKVVEDSLDISLPSLTEVGDFYAKSSLIRKISLPKLKTVFSFCFNGQSLSVLDLSAVETVITDLAVESGTSFTGSTNAAYNQRLKTLSLKSLTKVNGSLTLRGLSALTQLDTPALESVGSNFTLLRVGALEKVDAPLLQEVKEAFSLKGIDAIESLLLPKLSHVGSLVFNSDPSYWTNIKTLKTLDISALETVTTDFMISNTQLEKIQLPLLRSAGNKIDFDECESLIAIEIPVLEECKTFELGSMSILTSLDVSTVKQLEQLNVVSCYKLALIKGADNIKNITLNGGSRLCDFTQFEGIQTIPGTLTLSNYYQNDYFSFPGIKHIGKFDHSSGLTGVSVIDLPDLETIEYLRTGGTFLKTFKAPKLTIVSDTWDTSYMNNVVSGDIEMPNLKKIGIFKFYGGTYAGAASQMKLTDMSDFKSLEEVGKVDIKWWGKMTDFSGLKNIISKIDKANWSVSGCAYNPTYEQMKNGEWMMP